MNIVPLDKIPHTYDPGVNMGTNISTKKKKLGTDTGWGGKHQHAGILVRGGGKYFKSLPQKMQITPPGQTCHETESMMSPCAIIQGE